MSIIQPIVNLNKIDKILECLTLKQLCCHIEGSPNIGQLQSAYLALHSNERDDQSGEQPIDSDDSKSPSVLLSLDISPAFDTLNHHHLQRAIELFGFDDLVFDWLQSHLAGGEHFVTVDSRQSTTIKFSTGVLQGLVL